jgi:hypothetical protein
MALTLKIKVKDWTELTIEEAIKIVQLPMPPMFVNLLRSKTVDEYVERFDSLSAIDRIEFTKYIGDLLIICTNLTPEQVDLLQFYDRQAIFDNYLRKYVTSLFSNAPIFEPHGVEFFEHAGIRYEMPKSIKLYDDIMPMAGTEALQFIEGMNIAKAFYDMEQKGIEALPQLIAIYCKPEGEQYDEQKVISRAVEFKKLPMSIAWEVFFCISTLLNKSAVNILESLKDRIKET